MGWDISFSQTAGSNFPALFADSYLASRRSSSCGARSLKERSGPGWGCTITSDYVLCPLPAGIGRIDLPCLLCTLPDLLRTLGDGVSSSERSYAGLAHALARTLGRLPVGTGTDAMGLAPARPTLGSPRPPSVFSGEGMRGMGQGYRLTQGVRRGDQTLRI